MDKEKFVTNIDDGKRQAAILLGVVLVVAVAGWLLWQHKRIPGGQTAAGNCISRQTGQDAIVVACRVRPVGRFLFFDSAWYIFLGIKIAPPSYT